MAIYQGDLQLKKIKELPKGLKEKDNVLLKGETTGHSHRFEGAGVKTMVDNSGNQFCVVEQPSLLVHEEHHQITVPVGIYAIRRQREFDLVKGVKQVCD